VAEDITFGSFPAAAYDFGDPFRVPFSTDPTGLPNARISDANPMASFLRTEDGLREMQRLLQDFVVRLDFHLLAPASARQLRAVREWLWPTATQCPELHAHLPDGYGLPDFVLETGHNSHHILTSEERRALREQVPYHLHAPEPSELKQQDKATLPANVVSADNASREQQVKLRPRIKSKILPRPSIQYSLNPKKATVGHKNFSFCEQTLHKGLIDASCNCLQSTRKNRGQNKLATIHAIGYNPCNWLQSTRKNRGQNKFV
jgi:hypothetical protein